MDVVIPSAPQSTVNVPAFLAKLWKMVDDPTTDGLISWSAEGTSFIIHNQGEFAQSLLPFYYKHCNMASFIRQLNMYGFHKVVGIESGGLKSEKHDEMEFAHSFFLRGMEVLLTKIKRKVSSGHKSASYTPVLKTEKVNEVFDEVQRMKERQESMDTTLDAMKSEDEALWREVVSLRQKHLAQQRVINKLIHFLVSIVQPRVQLKRKYPFQLAIEDSYEPSEKAQARPEDDDQGKQTSSTSAVVNVGPIISEVTPEGGSLGTANTYGSAGSGSIGLTSAARVTSANMPANSFTVPVPAGQGGSMVLEGLGHVVIPNEVSVEMPDTPQPQTNMSPVTSEMHSTTSTSSENRPHTPVMASVMQPVDPRLVNPAINTVYKVKTAPSNTTNLPSSVASTSANASKGPITSVTPKRPTLHREISKEEFDQEMNVMQTDIDNLRDVLSGHIKFDSNFLTSLFNPEEPLFPSASQPSPTNSANETAALHGSSLRNPQHLQLEIGHGNGTTDASTTGESSLVVQQVPANLFDLEGMASQSGHSDTPKGVNKPDEAATLNTPIVFADDDDPLVAHMRN